MSTVDARIAQLEGEARSARDGLLAPEMLQALAYLYEHRHADTLEDQAARRGDLTAWAVAS